MNKKAILSLSIPLLLSIPITVFCQSGTANTMFVNPTSLAAPKGYSHAAVVDLGSCRMVILSGQVPLDAKGNLVGSNDLTEQTRQVFTNIKNILTELGGSMQDIVKLGYFITDAAQIQKIRDVRDQFINSVHPPASTLVQVSRLFREDVMIEVEATAILPKK